MSAYDAKPRLRGTEDDGAHRLDEYADRRQLVRALREHVWRCMDCRSGFAVEREAFAREGFGLLCPLGQQLARCLATYAGWVLPTRT